MQRAQFESVRREVPMLLAVAGLNIAIIMAVCAHDGAPFLAYGWMSLLLLYCLLRFFHWSRLLREEPDQARIPGFLKTAQRAALLVLTALGIDAAAIFLTGLFRSELLVPISLAFGSMAIAHCLYALRPAAIGALVMGLFPSAIAMIAAGNFEAKMLGCSMISVAVLMLRFVTAQHDQLIRRLLLEKQNSDLANTDPLTGLANRRAIMAALDEEANRGTAFAVVLIDLDGFKQVNDTLGHQAGDRLLCVIADRLCGAARCGDVTGRLGGDEFIVLLRSVAGEADASARAGTMLAALCRPVAFEGAPVRFGASLGFAVPAGPDDAVESLLRRADDALYRAKRDGRGSAPERRHATAR